MYTYMCMYIYIYIHMHLSLSLYIYIYTYMRAESGRRRSYRLSTEIYGIKLVFHEYLLEACFVLTEISGNLREFTGECNLGILYSSSLLVLARKAFVASAALIADPASYALWQASRAKQTKHVSSFTRSNTQTYQQQSNTHTLLILIYILLHACSSTTYYWR